MKKKHLRIIKQIQEGIPQDLLKRLTKTELQSPTIKKVFEKALVDPATTERQRRNIQAMLDSGKLDKTVEVLDHEVEKLIDAYLAEEISKAVKLGRLPAEAPKMEGLKDKGLQYARRNEKRLRTLFTGKSEDVDDSTKEDQGDTGSDSQQQADHGALPEPTPSDQRI